MKPVYERTNLRITEFDTEDVIATSTVSPDPLEPSASGLENAYRDIGSFGAPSSWW